MVKLAQRYVRAVGSSNLKSDELHFDADVLMAVALSSGWGALLFRVKYFNDPDSYVRLRAEWTEAVAKKAGRRAWPEHIPVGMVAVLSLRRWVSSVCPACTGRKQETIFNTPSLSAKNCALCDGTGEMPLRCDERIKDYVNDMVEELHGTELRAGLRGQRKLQRDAERVDLAEAFMVQKPGRRLPK